VLGITIGAAAISERAELRADPADHHERQDEAHRDDAARGTAASHRC
jgi:hypothetical protein